MEKIPEATSSQKKLIIEKFVRKKKPNWPNEMRLAKGLLAKHGMDVFLHLILGYDLNSLAFFRSARGNEIIEKEKRKMKTLENKAAPVIEEDNVEYQRKTEEKKTLKGILGI
jgi:hypothetical protein